jgi:hypothetical protein
MGKNSLSPLELPKIPAWAVPQHRVTDPTEAAFYAGAALTSLDLLVRAEPVWAGAWRNRLALKCAAAGVRLAGRTEDAAALRDAFSFRRPGDELGPAGNLLVAFRRLASRSPAVDLENLRGIVDWLGLRWSDDLVSIPKWIEALERAEKPAPFAAAAIADLVLARRLRWPFAVPLLISQVQSAAFRPDADKARIKPGGPGFEAACCLALVFAAAEACALANGIAAHAARLKEIAPKLRAKGAGE